MHMTTKEANANSAIKAAIEKANARKLPLSPALDGADEKTVVSEIVTALRLQGYCTPREWKPGAKGLFIRVGQRNARGSGSDEGAPDLILIHLGTGRCTLVEVKARTKAARASKEQNTLRMLGLITIVKSAGETLALLENA